MPRPMGRFVRHYISLFHAIEEVGRTLCYQFVVSDSGLSISRGNEGALHLGPERARVYYDLSPDDKDRYNVDIWATNILLQGLPKDIYTLINHYPDAKDIWDNVKMLMEGSELTKEGRES
ncbi:hypothetical protein Tco_0843236 [Tanacetum coccineum]|uniref:Integrase, catalytic region, zinc finger, CCHC-type, peptidase aspartic, catalytic n=1 Tax=Tanacetum coccineum TaxID=301880 RepID=A0ABQ5B5W3_9ASTR